MNELSIWAEIDLNALAHNVRELRRVTSPGAGVMAVVKANAYGHGAVKAAGIVLEHGADCLGVARLHEGVQLRNAGISAPILIFGYSPASVAREIVQYDLTQTVYSLESAEALSDAALKAGKKIEAHLKVDTGMGRLGLSANETFDNAGSWTKSLEDAAKIAALPGLELEGIYTHFACADSAEKASAFGQLERFLAYLEDLRRMGIEPPVRHAANSAAIIDMHQAHLDLVRPGIALYGLYPSDEVDRSRISLKPVMQFKSRVTQVKRAPAGFKVSYGSTYETPRDTHIATIAAGYADGYNRLLSSRGVVLINGKRRPVVGRVCMDQTMVDVGPEGGAAPGDEVVLFGRQGDEVIHVDEVAASIGTINYEVVSCITARVPRIYSDSENL